jgi:hypothetical protein
MKENRHHVCRGKDEQGCENGADFSAPFSFLQ